VTDKGLSSAQGGIIHVGLYTPPLAMYPSGDITLTTFIHFKKAGDASMHFARCPPNDGEGRKKVAATAIIAVTGAQFFGGYLFPPGARLPLQDFMMQPVLHTHYTAS